MNAARKELAEIARNSPPHQVPNVKMISPVKSKRSEDKRTRTSRIKSDLEFTPSLEFERAANNLRFADVTGEIS
jgi:hypothetical protein